jgi:hypothetical protein
MYDVNIWEIPSGVSKGTVMPHVVEELLRNPGGMHRYRRDPRRGRLTLSPRANSENLNIGTIGK